ncbi:MAG: SDR family oxidoreductase [Pseudomonadota bacterium]
MDRKGHVAEIASAARFLCLPDQAYITGQVLHVNGGMFLGS